MMIEKRKKNWWYLLQLQAKPLKKAKLLRLQSQKEYICRHCQEKLMKYNIFLEFFFQVKMILKIIFM